MNEVRTSQPTLVTFSARNTPLLTAGNTMTPLGAADNLWLHLKVYATGGENGLHCHPEEDHAFVVLAGEAVFEDEGGAETAVRAFEGVIVPRGALYRFRSAGDGNLVMLRAGSAGSTESSLGLEAARAVRSGADGTARPGDAPDNLTGAEPPVAAPGAFFAPD